MLHVREAVASLWQPPVASSPCNRGGQKGVAWRRGGGCGGEKRNSGKERKRRPRRVKGGRQHNCSEEEAVPMGSRDLAAAV